MPIVTMPDGARVSFPDTMPKDQIRDLIVKKFPNAERESQALSGAKPYQNMGQAIATSVAAIPGQTMEAVSGLKQQASEGLAGDPNKVFDRMGANFEFSQHGIDEANLKNWAERQLGIDPWKRTPETEAQVLALVRSPQGKTDYEKYLKGDLSGLDENGNDKYLGNDPKTMAKTELAAQLERQQIAKNTPQLDVRPGSPEAIVGGAIGSTVQMVPAIVASVLTRNPAPAMIQADLISHGTAYGQARDAGLSPEMSANYGLLYGLAEGIPEALPVGVLLKEGGGLIARAAKAAGAEGMQEGFTEILQAMLDSGTIQPDMKWKDVLPRVRDAALTGAVAGAALAPVSHLTDKLAGHGAHGATAEDVSKDVLGDNEQTVSIEPEPEAPIEEQLALPAPNRPLALPPPEAFAPPAIIRRHPQRAEDATAQGAKLPVGGVDVGLGDGPRFGGTINPDGTFDSPGLDAHEADVKRRAEQEADYQARVALKKTKQDETVALLKTAREAVTPLGTFSKEEVGGDAAQRVGVWRSRIGRPIDDPISIDDMARAKVPQAQIDKAIAARRPMTAGKVFQPLDIHVTARAKNIVSNDSNFRELARRTTGSEDVERMTQTQLHAFKSVLDTMPAHPAPVTVPIADVSPFTEEHYGKALDAIRKAGRYTSQALKDATGLKNQKDVAALRDAMVRRGQLVQRSPNDFRLYDVIGQERQTTPNDLPPGAFSEHVVRRIPVNKVRIKQNGKSIGTFASGTEARGKIRELRAAEAGAATPSQLELTQAEDVGYGVMENRYDEEGNLLGQVVVDTHPTEEAARAAADRLNTPDVSARYTQTAVERTRNESAPVGENVQATRPAPPPELLGQHTQEILDRLNKTAAQRGLPLLGVKVQLARTPITTPEGIPIEGVAQSAEKLIILATQHLDPSMSADDFVDRLAQVMDHETIHALRNAGVLGPETEGWKTIIAYARKTKRPGMNETYLEYARRVYSGIKGYEKADAIEEEAIAEAFRHWAANRRSVVGKPATVFRQLVEWFRRLRAGVPESLFNSIATGQIVTAKLRPPGVTQPRAKATEAMQKARDEIKVAAEAAPANPALAENLIRVKSREFLRARAQAREDRYGRSGPKTIIGTTPTKTYAAGKIMDRDVVNGIVERFKAKMGLSKVARLQTLLPLDVAYMQRVADAQAKASHDPGSPAAQKAYRAFIAETRAMFDALVHPDVKIVPWTGNGSPYKSPAEITDAIGKGELKLRLSSEMFGPGADNPNHPMNQPSGIKTADGRVELTNNDLFRIVHDVYGHGQSGFRDDPRGQYNAYHEHARLYSEDARRALATETLAQSAWANFGPHLRRRDGTVPRETDVDYLKPDLKEFAQQKAFLLDPRLAEADPGLVLAEKAGGATAEDRFMVGWHGTPHKVDKFSKEKIGTGEGAQAFGYGLYFAGRREIAEWYKNALSRGGTFSYTLPDGTQKTVSSLAGEQIAKDYGLTGRPAYVAQYIADEVRRGKTVDGAIAAARKDYEHFDAADVDKGVKAITDANIEIKSEGNIYKVDLPEDDQLLDWDAPLSAQPPKVKEALAKLGFTEESQAPEDPTGSQIYNRARPGVFSNDAEASKALHDAGIPGHRYHDAGSRLGGNAAALVQKYGSRAKALEIAKQRAADASIPSQRRDWERDVAQLEEPETHNYVIYDDQHIQILEENPRYSVFAEDLPGGRLYGNPARSPGGQLSKPGTPSPVFTNDRAGNTYFGGAMADHQLGMARTAERGTALIYMSPGDYLSLTSGVNPEQDTYDGAVKDGYKLSTLPSLVLDGYVGNVRASSHDGAHSVRAILAANPEIESIPVVLYPKDRGRQGLGLVTAIEGHGASVAFPGDGYQEFNPEVRGPRWSVDSEAFRKWFGNSKVVGPDGRPLVAMHGSDEDFNAFSKKAGREGLPTNGFFFTADPSYGYIQRSPIVYPVFLRIENPYFIDRSEKMEGLNAWNDAGAWIDELRAKGHDGIIWGDPTNLQKPPAGAWGDDRSQLYVFEPTQIKSAIGNNGQYDATNPDIRYSVAAPFGTRVPDPPPPDLRTIIYQQNEGRIGRFLNSIARSKRHIPVIGSVFDLRTKVGDDRMLSVKEMIEHIQEMGGNVNDLNDTYMKEQLYHGKVFNTIEKVEEAYQKPLLEALAAAREQVSVKDFEDYLYARHAPERNAYLRSRGSPVDDPSGMSDQEANDILDKLALDGKLPMLDQLASRADAITKATTRIRVKAGLITQEAANSSPYQFYVPLRGFAEEDLDPDLITENQTRARSGKGFTVGGREDRTVTGRKRKAGDVIGHLFLQQTEAIIRAHKNEVATSFIRLLNDNTEAGYGKVLRSAPTRRVVGANGMIHEAGDPSFRQRPDIVTAKVQGKEVIAQVTDPRVARAIRSDYVSNSNVIVQAMTKLNRYLATVNTSLQPTFVLTNFLRDLQTAGVLAQQYDIPGLTGSIMKGTAGAAIGIREVLRKGTANSPWAQMFKDMQADGGTTEFLGIHDLEQQVRRIQKQVSQQGSNPSPRKALEMLGHIGKFVEDYNKTAENALRLSAYAAARRAGISRPQAAFLAKNLTVNFNKGGEQKSMMNAWWLFYNASLQGTTVFIRGLKSKNVRRVIAGVVMMGVMQDVLNRLMSGDSDDNGVPDYDDVPDYILEHNLVFMLPGSKNYVKIPLPYGLNVFHNTGRNLAAAFSGSPTRNVGTSVMSTVMTALETYNPIGGVQSLLNFVAPTIADPIVDLATNRDFSGKPIVPEQPSFGPPKPNSQKYWNTTGDMPKNIAQWLNAATGGNDVRPGKIDVSPEQLEYVYGFITGGLGTFASQTAGGGINLLQGRLENVAPDTTPFVNRVYGEVGERNTSERYYQMAEDIEYTKNEIKNYAESGNRPALEAKLRSSSSTVRLIPMFDAAHKSISTITKQLKDLDASKLPDAKKREIELKLKTRRDEIMRQVSKAYMDAQRAGSTVH